MKNKVLFVVSCFYHGGAEREMYELDCALDRTKIEPTILCLSELNDSKHFQDYFYEKHINNGTKIHFFNEFKDLEKKSFKNKILNKLGFKPKCETTNKKLNNFLKEYNQVFFMGEYVYKDVSAKLENGSFNRVNIFIMSARFQGEKYRNFNKENKYTFIGPFDTKEQVDFEFEGFIDYKHVFLPLSFVIDPTLNKWSFTDNKIKKIGIFTRLNKAKPLDPFFYTFHLLLKYLPDVELHIFGAGDYKEAGYDRYLNHLNLNDKVVFRGHQENMVETLNNENLNLVWFQGYLNRPAGYAGQDVSVTGTPMLLWDFFLGDNPNINDLSYIYPHFKDIELFKDASIQVLLKEELAKNISERQYLDVLEHKDMKKNIKNIEPILLGK